MNIVLNFLKIGLASFIVFTGSGIVLGQKYEAETVPRTSQAEIVDCEECSGGKAVNMKDGDLNFTIDISEEGYYKIDLRCSSPYGDGKQQKIRLDTSVTATVDFGTSFDTFTVLTGINRYKFTKGKHPVDILNFWGHVVIDYIEILPVEASTITPFHISGLTNPSASLAARRLYDYLRVNFGKKTISGVQMPPGQKAAQEVSAFESKTGHKPALIGLDFLFDVGLGTDWHAKGADSAQIYNDVKMWYSTYQGIVALCWHWKDPLKQTEGFYSPSADNDQEKTSFDIKTVFDTTSAGYKAMIEDMDVIARQLKKMRDDSIPVLWRPLHEASGGWFWWGVGGPEACKRLWKIMFDRYIHVHGLDNLIWVWTTDTRSSAVDWYPGNDYVDIVGMDIYTSPPEHSSQVFEFEKVKDMTGGKKIITLSECGAIPSAKNMVKDGANWSWFMPWYHDYTIGYHNQVATWEEIFGSDYIIKAEDLPAWKDYKITVPTIIIKKEAPINNSYVSVINGTTLLIALSRTTFYGHFAINIFSVNGAMLRSINSTKRLHVVSPRQAVLDISALANGSYVLAIERKGIRVVKKFTVAR